MLRFRGRHRAQSKKGGQLVSSQDCLTVDAEAFCDVLKCLHWLTKHKILTSTLSAILALTWETQLALTILSRASRKCQMPQATQWRIQSIRKPVHPPTMYNHGWIHRLIHCQAAWDSCTVFEHGDCYITVQVFETSQYVAECACYYQKHCRLPH